MTEGPGPAEPGLRPVLAVVAAALLAAAGAVLLGEQPLEGVTALVAGALFGTAIAELIVSVARYGDVYLGLAGALLTEAGIVWALYIETGHRLDAAAPEAWVAIAVGGATAVLWLRSASRRVRHNRPSA